MTKKQYFYEFTTEALKSFLVEKTIKLVENSLCLPSSTNISDDNIYEVINHLRH